MTRFKVGDKVLVREDLMSEESGKRYYMRDRTISDVANEGMLSMAGKEVTISEITSNGKYRIKEYCNVWLDEMFDTN